MPLRCRKISPLKFALPAAVYILLLACSARAQYRFDSWTTADGLPQNSVYSILQTGDGYIWLTTLDGLARFDGVRFTVFNKANSPGIKSNRFTGLFESGDGSLWAATDNSGVTRFRHGVATTYTTEDGLPYNNVRGISGDAAGGVWILSGDRIMRFDDGRFTPADTGDLSIKFNNSEWNKNVFLGVKDNILYRFQAGNLTARQVGGEILSSLNYRFEEESSEKVWVGISDGRAAKIEGGAALKIYRPDETNGELLGGNSSDPEMSFDYRTGGGDQFKISFNFNFARSLTARSSGVTKTVAFDALFEDREGNVWLGTNGQGLFRVRRQLFTVYSKPDGLIEKNVYPIFQTAGGAIWLGAWRGGLSRYENGKFVNFAEREGIHSSLPTAIYEDRDGLLWTAFINDFGDNFRVFKDGKFEKPVRSPSLPERSLVSVMYQERDKTFWFGTNGGLARLQNGETRIYTIEDGLAGLDVRAVIESRAGGLWIGSYGGLSRLKDGKFTAYTEADGLPSGNIRALYEDADGALWIGTYDGGLGRFADEKFTAFSTANGLYDNGVFQILEDAAGNFWMSSNRGIHRVSKRELNEFAAGRIAAFNSSAFGASDGLLNVECNGGAQPAGVRAADGRLWFPTQDGAAVIDPQAVPFDPNPPLVVIEMAKIDNQESSDFQSEIRNPKPETEMQPGQNNLEIAYTGLSFVKPEQIRFRYRMEGLDADWTEAGGRRAAYYPYLPPGEYTFRVIAANSDGVWNNDGATIRIVVLPPFYRTFWFVGLTILSLAIAGFALYRRRVAGLERRRHAQEEFSRRLINAHETERRRIAAELHDSIGQSLAMIKNRAVFGAQSITDSAAREHLETITAQTAQTIGEVREISYNLRPYLLDRLGLTKAIKSLANKIAETNRLKISAEITDVDNLFESEAEMSVYRIIQESLNNVVKHAAATEAVILVEKNKRGLTISIADDGKGFDTDASPGGDASRGGFGLLGMTERVRMLGGSQTIESRTGTGTKIIINIPLRGIRRENDDGQSN